MCTIDLLTAFSSVLTGGRRDPRAVLVSSSEVFDKPGRNAYLCENVWRRVFRTIVEVGAAAYGKAIIILNPAEPPLPMRDTVVTLSSGADEAVIEAAVLEMVARLQRRCEAYRISLS